MSGSLRFMTFNIRHGRALDGPNRWYMRRDLVFEVIREWSPHVLGLQEAHHFQLEELMPEFPGMALLSGRRYGGPRGTHAAILFDTERLEACQSGDFWLSPEPDGERMRSWDAAMPRVCNWAVFADKPMGRARFAVYNTHFDHVGAEARLESARLVVSRIADHRHMPCLVLGDLNVSERRDPLRVFFDAGFRDSFRDLHPEVEAFTFHGFKGKGIKRLGKIDYILCDDRWKVIAASVIKEGNQARFPSDHFPVVAELTFDSQARR